MNNYNHIDYIYKMDKYFRCANYISAGQIYLKNNAFLRENLKKEDIKERLVGHWGTVPSQNFIYTHLNRIINKYDLNIMLISGPGHGGNFMFANSYIEGVYSEYFKDIPFSEDGMNKLFKQFSFPGGTSSHVAAEVPGSIHEGGELGYSLLHGIGSVLDNKDLITAVIVGDGEAETGPLQASWHASKFLNPETDGVVLPIINLNGYKIAGPTLLARMTNEELINYFKALNWEVYIVEEDEDIEMHKDMAMKLDQAVAKIMNIKQGNEEAIYPLIILKSKKGWSGPKFVDGKEIEGTFRSHQVPINIRNEEDINLLEEWLKSYKFNELIENEYLIQDILDVIPRKGKRISENVNTFGGIKKVLHLKNIEEFAYQVSKRGSNASSDMTHLGNYLKEVVKDNQDNFIMLSPDENNSNRLQNVLEVTSRRWNYRLKDNDEKLSKDGRVFDSVLSEHFCEGILEGYVLTGRHGMFSSYEAFLRVVDSMIGQHFKWLKSSSKVHFRKEIPSLNIISTSYVWQQDHNGYTHQDPGIINHLLSKDKKYLGIYFPIDVNTMLVSAEKMLKSTNKINLLVGSKHERLQWLNIKEAKDLINKGIDVLEFASTEIENPDIIISGIGSEPSLEAIAAINIINEIDPSIKIRYVQVLDLMKLSNEDDGGLNDTDFNKLFTKDKPIIFNFHGYRDALYAMLYQRENKNIKVNGYQEEGMITTPFDIRVMNKIDRFHLVKDIVNMLNHKMKDEINNFMDNKLLDHYNHIRLMGTDLDEINEYKFSELKADKKTYNQTHIRGGVGTIILDDNYRILLGRRSDNEETADSELHEEGTWTLPGGNIEWGETFEAAAVREIEEETGIKVNEDDLRLMAIQNDKNEHAHYISVGFVTNKFEGEAKVMEPNEITMWKWFEFEELPRNIFTPARKTIDCLYKGEFYIKKDNL